MNLLSSLLAYTARQIAALRSKDTSQDTEISGAKGRLTTAESNISTLISRIETAISAVTTDTEVTDIRVGDDGATYGTAGTAVRTQFSNLKDELVDISGVNSIKFTDGEYITTVSPNNTVSLTPVNNATMSYAYVTCHKGDVFTISGTPANSTAQRPYMFTDTDLKCLVRSSETNVISDLVIEAPSDGYLIVNFTKANVKSFYVNRIDLYNQIVELQDEVFEEVDFAFSDIFPLLEDTFADDFYPRVSFVDSDYDYEVFGDSSVVPTMEVGRGAYTQNAASNVLYVREFDTFPHFVTVGHMPNAAINFPLYVKGPTDIINIYLSSTGAVQYNGVTYGSLNVSSKWYLYRIERNGVYVYDDVGCFVFVPVVYKPWLPKNCGMWFGTVANRIYGYGSWVEWEIAELNSYNMNKVIEYHSQKMKYTHNNTVYNDIDQNPYVSIVQNDFSNNPCLQFVCDWDDSSYRTEASIREPARNLYNEQGMLQRFKFSAAYFVSSDNLEGGYRTYIFQIHDGGFAADGWVDPPPVHVHFENGKLYAEICYLPNGEIPTGNTLHTNDQYLLGDLPLDKWFTLEIEARISWRDGMMPYTRICLNGSEKVNINTPVGFNIPSSGGFTDIQFGNYNPEWKGGGGSYTNKSRTILVTNIKFEF